MSLKEENQDLKREIIRLREEVYRHISTSNEELGQVKEAIEWLKKGYWVVASASVGSFLAILVSFLVRK